MKVFYPAESLCRVEDSAVCLFKKDESYLFFDTGHLSYFVSE